MAERAIGMVYGGASVGIMGKLADAVLAGGGEAIGVIPVSLVDRELAHLGLTELIKVHTLTERKLRMFELSSGFLTLPGGFGTLDELFEVITWAILGYHSKPCVVLDLDGYYHHIRKFIDHALAEGFVDAEHRDLMIVASDPRSAIDALELAISDRSTNDDSGGHD